jgi:type VI secretion system protein ImpH
MAAYLQKMESSLPDLLTEGDQEPVAGVVDTLAGPLQQQGGASPSNPVRQKLLQEPYVFNFYKAVQLLELFAGGYAPGKGISPTQDPVHFSVRPGFGFPASEIQEIKVNGSASAPKMAVNFMGLIGPQGVLPDWYNTHAQDCNCRKDYCFTDFLDLFHHRLISLFYLAWKKYRLVENYSSDGSDQITGILGKLAGIGEHGQADNPIFFEYARKRLIHFCGLVSRSVPTVAAIETVVAHAVGAPVHVEQFIERLIPIHKQDRTCLGRKNSTLKKDALCGRSIRDSSSFFRVEIGPLPWKNYMALNPRSPNLELVRKLITHLAGIEYEFEIRLIIRGPEVPALCLGSKTQAPALGRTATLRRPQRPYINDITVKGA